MKDTPGEDVGPSLWQHHAGAIRAAYFTLATSAVEGFIRVGQALLAAQKELGEVSFNQMYKLEMLPFSKRQGYAMMQVAANPVLVQRVAQLPPHVGTLTAIASLPGPVLEAAIANGDIHAGLERGAAIKVKARLLRKGPAQRRDDPLVELKFTVPRSLRSELLKAVVATASEPALLRGMAAADPTTGRPPHRQMRQAMTQALRGMVARYVEEAAPKVNAYQAGVHARRAAEGKV
jgi:hypothetical protein